MPTSRKPKAAMATKSLLTLSTPRVTVRLSVMESSTLSRSGENSTIKASMASRARVMVVTRCLFCLLFTRGSRIPASAGSKIIRSIIKD